MTHEEWQALCKEVYQRRKEEAMGFGICAECGQNKTIKARGLCSACYQKLQKEGKLPPKQKDSGLNQYRIVVDFSFCPVLFEKLKERAEAEMRPVNIQLLWELKKAFLLNGKEKKGGTV